MSKRTSDVRQLQGHVATGHAGRYNIHNSDVEKVKFKNKCYICLTPEGRQSFLTHNFSTYLVNKTEKLPSKE